MNSTTEAALRSAAVVIAFALLGWLETATNLNGVIGNNWAGIIAAIAAVILGALDKYFSPDGTVLAGTVGSVLR